MKFIKTLSVLMILTGICFSCQKPELDNLPVSPVTVESLITPRDNMSLSISNATSGLTFEWEASEWHGEGKPRYRLVFDVPGGDFSEPRMTFETESDTITLAQDQLREVFDAVKDGNSRFAAVTWSVVAISGEDELLAEVSYNLDIDGTPAPEDLFIGGEGAEAGQKFTLITPLTYYNVDSKYADVTGNWGNYTPYYEIYTRLEEGKKYYFYSGEYYFNAESFMWVADEAAASVTATDETAVYRIRINPETKEVKKVKVTFVVLDNPWGDDKDGVLEYKGRGVWGLSCFNIRLHVADWDHKRCDTRYRFYMTFDGVDNKQGFGAVADAGDAFWVQPTGAGQWDEWMFDFPEFVVDQNDEDRYSAEVNLYMNNDKGHYTHEFVNVTEKN